MLCNIGYNFLTADLLTTSKAFLSISAFNIKYKIICKDLYKSFLSLLCNGKVGGRLQYVGEQ